ncbi:hypothetical protein AB0H76_15045 [Nocardia sp. NPDC050712]|uniref:hypothetical protein n=1 Tax=Nocardia sp. NPDC050712 TaxID=3155518 RepID=UPI0033C96FD9
MSTHSPACQRLLAELLSTPKGSVDHDIAAYVRAHSPAEGWTLVLTAILEDAPQDTVGARRLWPLLNAEVAR